MPSSSRPAARLLARRAARGEGACQCLGALTPERFAGRVTSSCRDHRHDEAPPPGAARARGRPRQTLSRGDPRERSNPSCSLSPEAGSRSPPRTSCPRAGPFRSAASGRIWCCSDAGRRGPGPRRPLPSHGRAPRGGRPRRAGRHPVPVPRMGDLRRREVRAHPYADTIPPRARTRAWEVRELDGLILVHHALGGEPAAFEIPPLAEARSTEWSPKLSKRWRVRTHVQETLENIVDPAHFVAVHGMLVPPGPRSRSRATSSDPGRR